MEAPFEETIILGGRWFIEMIELTDEMKYLFSRVAAQAFYGFNFYPV